MHGSCRGRSGEGREVLENIAKPKAAGNVKVSAAVFVTLGLLLEIFLVSSGESALRRAVSFLPQPDKRLQRRADARIQTISLLYGYSSAFLGNFLNFFNKI